MNSVPESFIKLTKLPSSVLSTLSYKAYICSLLAFPLIWKHLFLLLVAILPQKTVLFCFNNKILLFWEQNLFRKKPLGLLSFHQLQLTFGMKNFWINCFLYDLWVIFHGSISKVPTKMDYFLKKLTFPTWGASMSKRFEMIMNYFPWLKTSSNLMWWSITWKRIQKYIRINL